MHSACCNTVLLRHKRYVTSPDTLRGKACTDWTRHDVAPCAGSMHPRRTGAQQQQRRMKARGRDGYLDSDVASDECEICLEPYHPKEVLACGHRRHADPLLDCCLCNCYDPGSEAPNPESVEAREERPRRQRRLWRAHEQLRFFKPGCKCV